MFNNKSKRCDKCFYNIWRILPFAIFYDFQLMIGWRKKRVILIIKMLGFAGFIGGCYQYSLNPDNNTSPRLIPAVEGGQIASVSDS